METVKVSKTVYEIIEAGVMDNGTEFWKIRKGNTIKTLCKCTFGFDLMSRTSGYKLTWKTYPASDVTFL